MPPPPPAPVGAALPALKARVAALEKQFSQGQIPADPQNLALLRFKLEQAHLWFNKLESPAGAFEFDGLRWLNIIVDRLEIIARTAGDAVYPAATQQHERAYISPADNSPQPYWVYVPANYSPRRKYPLVVFLHGYAPEITKAEPWLPGEATWKLATERDMILVVPYGRRNSDFVGIGEDDTLTVTNEVKKYYSVDGSRVFLLGISMGGYGAHAVAMHRPDVWTGVTPMCGRTDFYLWFGLKREELPAWKQVLYDADDPRHLKANAMNLPIFMQHGALDNVVPTEHSRRFFADLRALGYPVRYREIGDGDHYIYWHDWSYIAAFEWMKTIQPTPVPRHVRYSTAALRNKGAYWATINSFNDYSRLAHLDAEVRPDNTIHVVTDNIGSFTLTPPASFFQAGKPVTLIVNGVMQEQQYSARSPVQWPIKVVEDETYPSSKSPARCGPIKEVYRDPFLLVCGRAEADIEQARRFAREWFLYADGKPPLKADREVTPADRQNYNLVLFGTRHTNSILAEIADKLPVELTARGFRLGRQEYSGRDLGMQLCYPSPFSPQRMIVVQSGEYWGGALPINHKYDLLPEYIIYDTTLDLSDSTNRAIVAGFFDHNWQLTKTAPVEIQSRPPAPPEF